MVCDNLGFCDLVGITLEGLAWVEEILLLSNDIEFIKDEIPKIINECKGMLADGKKPKDLEGVVVTLLDEYVADWQATSNLEQKREYNHMIAALKIILERINKP